MFKKTARYRRRFGFAFQVFRFLLSLIIFIILLGGAYSAYRHFSGFDPVKLSVKSYLSNILSKEKILEFALGFLTIGNKDKNVKEKDAGQVPTSSRTLDPIGTRITNKKPLFKFAIIADSHTENQLLAKALTQAKSVPGGVKFIIGLGDYTEVGTISELQAAKAVFDGAGIRYFVTAGDHDLWDARDKQKEAASNFVQTFGKTYQSFSYGNSRFIVLDNSDNYNGMGQDQMDWVKEELERVKSEQYITAILVFAHEPLYHPSSDRVMGKVTPKLKDEAKQLLGLFKDIGVKEIFAGDIHFFTEYQDPTTGIQMTTIGAVASLRNPQAPRYGIVTVFEDGSVGVEDVEIK